MKRMVRKLFLVSGAGLLAILAVTDALTAYTLRRLGRHLSAGNERTVRKHEPVTKTLVAVPSRQKAAA